MAATLNSPRALSPEELDWGLVDWAVRPAREKAIDYTERRVGDVVIVDLKGKATIGTPGPAMRQIVGGLLDRGERSILLNMAEVGYMDSGGIGDLGNGGGALPPQLQLADLSLQV